MTITTKTIIKTFFETGDKPTQSNFTDLIDSFAGLGESARQSFAGPMAFAALVSAGSIAATSLTLNGISPATLSNTLGDFASTTSLQLKNVISDETGSGSLVFANTPTLIAPVLGVATANSISFGQTALANYQEGTWTPTDASGAALAFSTAVGFYTRIGRQVICELVVAYPSTANGSNTKIGGLPFSANASSGGGFSNSGSNLSLSMQAVGSSTTAILTNPTSGATLINSALSLKTITGVFTYFI